MLTGCAAGERKHMPAVSQGTASRTGNKAFAACEQGRSAYRVLSCQASSLRLKHACRGARRFFRRAPFHACHVGKSCLSVITADRPGSAKVRRQSDFPCRRKRHLPWSPLTSVSTVGAFPRRAERHSPTASELHIEPGTNAVLRNAGAELAAVADTDAGHFGDTEIDPRTDDRGVFRDRNTRNQER